jgi:hypothetical protein
MGFTEEIVRSIGAKTYVLYCLLTKRNVLELEETLIRNFNLLFPHLILGLPAQRRDWTKLNNRELVFLKRVCIPAFFQSG